MTGIKEIYLSPVGFCRISFMVPEGLEEAREYFEFSISAYNETFFGGVLAICAFIPQGNFYTICPTEQK